MVVVNDGWIEVHQTRYTCFLFTSFFSEGFRKSSPCSFTVKTHGDIIERVLNMCSSRYGYISKTSFVTTLNPRSTELSTARSHQGSA